MAEARAKSHRRVFLPVGVVTTVLLSALIFGGSFLREREAALARARDAAIHGPPCPPLTRAEFEARTLKAPKATLYEDVVFTRQFGHMSCDALRYGTGWGTDTYPVCQFTSANVLGVRTAKGEWFYAPGPGVPATISTPHGQATCVLGARFTMDALVGR
ncbi:MAG: hypothetical protein U1C74_02260 [Phenylobacterium sp.]|nr:hypothetical protein [Phenylobacterium sp.]